MDFSANLSMQGKTATEMTQNLNGDASLRGENLTLNGSDLDLEFSRYESSQHFNIVDVGAVFLAGPVGLVVTKGYNFASILEGSGGSSKILKLVSEWKIEQRCGACAGRGHRDEQEPGCSSGRTRFRQRSIR